MTRQVLKKPEVRRDLQSQADFIAKGSVDAAERFIDAAEATFEFLAASPLVGGLCNFRAAETAGLRRWPVRGFQNSIIYYRPITDGIDVVRVIHAARDVEAIFTPGIGES